MPDVGQSHRATAKPWFEINRKLGPGYYQGIAAVYRHPFRLWVWGRWLIGGQR